MAVYTEQEVINGCLRKDRVYEEYLYKQYYGIFLAICMRYAKDMHYAKQLLNDGFVKIFMSIGSFRNEGSFEGWMKRIIVNTCLKYLSSSDFKKNSQVLHKDVVEEKGNMVVYNEAMQSIDAQDILALLQTLPPVTRVIFNLFAFDGYSHKEIAGMLNITIGTSSWHVHNARSILQQKIMVKNKLYEHK
jgi:RNA polymerase sigma factor (sigma-70 family)